MTIDRVELDDLCRAARAAAIIGGGVIAAQFGPGRWGIGSDVRAKAPGDYVSAVDLASEAAIRDELARHAPGIDFYGEEGGGDRGPLGWLVDPLDGTANFLHAFPVVGVSIALVEEGRPVVGVVHAPMLGTTFHAVRGGGAHQDDLRISVSERPPERAVCATGFPFKAKQRQPEYMPVFHAAFDAFEDLRRAGAASLDLAWVAAGVFDGFFEVGLGPWDIAAGALLIEEAGGIVTDWTGDPTQWLVTGDILTGNTDVHARLRALVEARPDPFDRWR